MAKIITYTCIAAIVVFTVLFSFHFILKSMKSKEKPISSENAAEARIQPGPVSMSYRIHQENQPFSVALFGMIVVLQVFAALVAFNVFRNIKGSDGSTKLKLKQLQNADIFLDLPLYIGLLGTVVSFIIITFSPNMGRLIAYSSTIIGIIVSVILRTILLYPYRQKLLLLESDSSDETENS